MSFEVLKDRLNECFADYDEEATVETVENALAQDVDPKEILAVLSDIVEDMGVKFSEGELFLPELVMVGQIMEVATEPVKRVLLASNIAQEKKGKVLLGTVKGDLHDIGKNMVKTMLVAGGFEVVDVGVDVAPSAFIAQIKETNPDIIALSSTMTSTMPMMKETIEFIRGKDGMKERKILVGGGSVSEMIAKEYGADGYSDDANSALQLCRQMIPS